MFSRTTARSWLLLATITFCFCASTPHATHAQDVQPRVYTPGPVGVGAAALAYSFSTGPVLFDKTIPIDDSEGDIHSVTAAYSRSVGVFGLSARTEIAVPFVTGTWTGNVVSATESSATDRTGFGDPVVRLSLFVFGAPALTPEKFTEFQPKTVVGATMLPIDEETALAYGRLTRHLRGRGELLGANDLWIAASTLRHELRLVTADVAGFRRVPGLELATYRG